MDLTTIREHIIELSGSGKRLSNQRRNGIYSSYTLPGLDDMEAVRDTAHRFEAFDVPESLEGKSVLDVGCNCGTMSFEALRRGADQVAGLEFREDRVFLCRTIAAHFGYDFKCLFQQADFNEDGFEYTNWKHFVFCCSVDEYINDRPKFYQWLYTVTRETLFFECNVQRDQSVDMTIAMFMKAGFSFNNIHHLGSGHSGGISRKRIIYRIDK